MNNDYPPATWLSPRPIGAVDWTLTVCVVVLAIPVVVVFGPIVWIVRAVDRVTGKAGA